VYAEDAVMVRKVVAQIQRRRSGDRLQTFRKCEENGLFNDFITTSSP
jgi:hypothetical protein